MFDIILTTQFKKDSKKYQNNSKAKGVILKVIELLQTGNLLPREYK